MQNRKRWILLTGLLISVLNFIRINRPDTMRVVEFLSVFAIGMFAGLLLEDTFQRIRNRKS
ncbi:MAG: hypothetical protein K2X48_13530 [Chitinophagaceae bacterium]|nr:hypothetical protein [Chitinophagaceae bacterium]MBX9784306.1 hypothetical protein [Chitinophagaceae bacterium]